MIYPNFNGLLGAIHISDVRPCFSRSTKRLQILEASFEACDDVTKLSMVCLSKGRWTANARAIRAVWDGYDCILEAIQKIIAQSSDAKAKADGSGLLVKLQSIDFVTSLMFMKQVIYKAENMTTILQKQELNLVDATSIIASTICTLQALRDADEDAMDAQVEAACVFASRRGIDPQADFERHHRIRKPSRRLDDNPDTTAVMLLKDFYRKEFYSVLDTIISELTDVKTGIENTLAPIFDTLTFRKATEFDDVQRLVEYFPKNARPDEHKLFAELEHFQIYIRDIESEEKRTFALFTKKAYEMRHILPLCYKAFCLALTAPVTVAQNERTFSKLRLVKNHMRTRMGKERLEKCMLMACEKDALESLDLERLVRSWKRLNIKEY